jgi:peptidoglycan/xylan/chitin deacetylase (PgdA/CDA1 family)
MTRAPDILLYHAVCDDREFPSDSRTNIRPGLFERQLDYIGRNFVCKSLGELPTEKSSSGKHPLAVTFDDGYADTYEVAYPLLMKYRVPVTFFLTVSQLDRDWLFPGGPYRGLDRAQIKKMGENQLVDFGSHGFTHRILTKIPPEELEKEIKGSKAILEAELGRPVSFFSYPHGSYSDQIKKMVREAGYQAAFSVISGWQNEYSYRRILISRRDNMFRFKLKLSPLYWPLRRIL